MTLQEKYKDIIAILSEHEGRVNHFYLDSVGLVTIGVGFMVPDEHSSMELTMVRPDGIIPLDIDLALEWQRINSMQLGMPASAYKAATKLIMTDAAIDAELIRRIQAFEANLRNRFPAYDLFPAPAKTALLDMIYNLGPAGLLKGYPMMCSFVDSRLWAEVAAESHREGIGRDRNQHIYNLFIQAITLDKAQS